MSNMSNRVLGIDPGLSRCGYGCVEGRIGKPSLVGGGVIRTDPHTALPVRLAALARDLRSVVSDYAPVSVAVEQVFFQTNVRTAIGVAQAAGVALLVAAEHGLAVQTYTPTQVKTAIAGYGGADKLAVTQMVQQLLRLDGPPRPADVADALALALCHLHAAPLQSRVTQADR